MNDSGDTKQMADKGITTVKPAGTLQAPDFIKRGAKIQGQDRLDEYVIPPTFKLVQKQSSDELQNSFGKGTTILAPVGAVVAPVNTPFLVTPILYYPEYLTWAPIEMKGKVPAVLDRSMDRKSALAEKATNSEKWSEANYRYTDKKTGAETVISKVRHVEHLVFLVKLIGHELGDAYGTMSFARAEHKKGRNFATLIKMRNAEMFGCIFQVSVSDKPRSNEMGSWYGWDVRNPDPALSSQWIQDATLFEQLRTLNLDFEKKYQDGLLRTNLEEDNGTEQTGEGETNEEM